jgi:hypothetical protein
MQKKLFILALCLLLGQAAGQPKGQPKGQPTGQPTGQSTAFKPVSLTAAERTVVMSLFENTAVNFKDAPRIGGLAQALQDSLPVLDNDAALTLKTMLRAPHDEAAKIVTALAALDTTQATRAAREVFKNYVPHVNAAAILTIWEKVEKAKPLQCKDRGAGGWSAFCFCLWV